MKRILDLEVRMSRTIVALYDDFSTANAVVRDLVNQGIPYQNFRAISIDASPGIAERLNFPGMLAEAGISEDEAGFYAEGLRSGKTLVTAEVDRDKEDSVRRVLENYRPVRLNNTMEDYRFNYDQEGWTTFNALEDLGVTTEMDWSADYYRYVNSTPYPPDVNKYDKRFQDDFKNRQLDVKDYSYDKFRPAYQYGYSLARNEKFRNKSWQDVESDARRDWEANNPDTWDIYADSILYAWEAGRENP